MLISFLPALIIPPPYLRQGGYAMPFVCLSPSLCVSLSLSLLVTLHKTTERNLEKILPQIYLRRRKNWLNFGT